MQLPDLAIIALIEGVADVLPVDATGHALAVSKLAGWRAGTIAASVHLGAALALLLYLWRDMAAIGLGLWRVRRRRIEPGTVLLLKAVTAALPWIVAVAALGAVPVPGLGDLKAVGLITIVSALLMGAVDRMSMTVKRIEHLERSSALVVGVIQLLALVPGGGRVAIGRTTARLFGLERPHAYRFVLLANLPILLVEGIGRSLHYYAQGLGPTETDLLAAAVTFLLVLLAVWLTMAWIRRAGLLPFCLYRLALGAGLIALASV
ncbi:MAG: undecaprenyl-diphosphate phosphatase [Telmatospirillum sp.]|nr:undecaprenyl-diphosphate phosphatase [Telmatospirillum sp.]